MAVRILSNPYSHPAFHLILICKELYNCNDIDPSGKVAYHLYFILALSLHKIMLTVTFDIISYQTPHFYFFFYYVNGHFLDAKGK